MLGALPELDLLTKEDLVTLVSNVKVKFRKNLSQHFVIEPLLIRDIISNIPRGSQVLEIGTGIGTLTYYLAKVAAHVVSIEIDNRLIRYAEKLLGGFSNVSLISGDALKLPWPSVDVVVSNVPFSITSPLIIRIIREGVPRALLTVQREVANRLLSAPGAEDYGRLSVIVQCTYEVKRIGDYPPEAFYPSPQVYSSLVSLTKIKPCIDDLEIIELVTNILFRHRNRKLKWVLNKYLGGDILRRIENININPEARVRDLTVNDIVNIAKELSDLKDELVRLTH